MAESDKQVIELRQAVMDGNAETTANLLRAAGGMCSALDLAKAAKDLPLPSGWSVPPITYSVVTRLHTGVDSEQLMMYRRQVFGLEPVGGYEGNLCDKK